MKNNRPKLVIARRGARRMMILSPNASARSLARFLPEGVPLRRRYRLMVDWRGEDWSGFVPLIRVRP